MRCLHDWRLGKRFLASTGGNVGLIFGLALVPLVGLTGVAIDFSRASQLRTKMSAAADAAALAATKAKGLTLAERRTAADAVFAANLGIDSRLVSVTGQLTKLEGSAYRYDVTASYHHTVLQALPGFGSATSLSATATAKAGDAFMEIALALDNTGSMALSSRMDELKRALCGNTTCSSTNPSTGFIKTMRDLALEDNQIRISLVPFDIGVRVPANVQAAVTSGSNSASTFAFTGAGYCGANTTAANRVLWSLSGAPAVSWFRFAERDVDPTASMLDGAGVNVGNGCGTGRATRTTWQGCVWDRDQDSNRDTTPIGVDTGTIATLYPATNCLAPSLARMAPLVDVRYNTAQLISALATMAPAGNTNVTVGATWGHNMLTPGAPMSTAAPSTGNLSRYLVILTDGDNTQNRFSTNQADIDARTLLACTAAKSRGIVVYAIRVMEGNETMLRNCASGSDYYFNITNASDLTAAFASIAARMGSVRLTQ